MGAATVRSVVSVVGYSFTVSLLIALAVKLLTGLRVPAEIEEAGIDELAHGEIAYALEEEDRLVASATS